MPIIEPTVGRVLLYKPGKNDADQAMTQIPEYVEKDVEDVRFPVTVCYVYKKLRNRVNVAGYDAVGVPFSRQCVHLQQDGMEPYPGDAQEGFCEWIPYQKAVASGQIPPTLHAQATAKE